MTNLPRFMDLASQVPMQYRSLQHQTLLSPPDTPTTASFPLWPHCALLSGAVSDLKPSALPQWRTRHLLTWRTFLLVLCLLLFHTVHGVLQSRILQWVAVSSSMDHTLPELFTMTYPSWWPCTVLISFSFIILLYVDIWLSQKHLSKRLFLYSLKYPCVC